MQSESMMNSFNPLTGNRLAERPEVSLSLSCMVSFNPLTGNRLAESLGTCQQTQTDKRRFQSPYGE